jgi:hypothetical protein
MFHTHALSSSNTMAVRRRAAAAVVKGLAPCLLAFFLLRTAAGAVVRAGLDRRLGVVAALVDVDASALLGQLVLGMMIRLFWVSFDFD